MAKNDLRTDGKEIVEAILAGKRKKEIEKEFRVSEEELATTLLPLYRAGDLTKDEFNVFFQGKSVQRVQEPPRPDATEPTDKPRTVKEPSAEAPEYSVSGTFKKFTEAAQEEPAEEPIEETSEEESLEMEEIDFEEEVDAPIVAEVAEDTAESTTPEPPEPPEPPVQPKPAAAPPPEPPAVAEEVSDFQDMRVPSKLERTLDKIWKRLDSIDRRLHEIGKKLDV